MVMYDKSIESKYEVLKKLEKELEKENLSTSLYVQEKIIKDEKLPCRSVLKFFRHYLPIFGFAFVFIFFWCKVP